MHHLVADLDDGRASGNGVVSDGILAASEDDVALAVDALGDLDGVAALDLGGLGDDGTGDGDESTVDGDAVVGLDLVAGGAEQDGAAGLDGGVVAAGDELGEGLDGEGSVVRGAGGDELGSQGVDLVQGERVVEGLGEGRLLDASADVRGVAGLNGEDGAGSSQVGLGHDVRGSAEVGGNTDACGKSQSV